MDENKEFEDLASRAGNIVGQAEAQARQIMGDEKYEYLQEVISMNTGIQLSINQAQLDMAIAQIRLTRAQAVHLNSLSSLKNSISGVALFVIPFMVSWSIWFWAVH